MSASIWKSFALADRLGRAAALFGPLLLLALALPVAAVFLQSLLNGRSLPQNTVTIVALAAVIFVAAYLLLLRVLQVSNREKGANDAAFSSVERPIRSKSEDILGRSEFIRRLSNTLIDTSTGRATGVVVGITGRWGSGKSSTLNLLAEEINIARPEAVVVRFDPWLVSGRDDLILEFMRELISTIKAEPEASESLLAFARSLTEYGAYLAPLTNLVKPGAEVFVSGALASLKARIFKDQSLAELRKRLIAQIQKIDVAIVVLIDELDRVEDSEIRTIAQLVRSVVDFPGISYVLAYDSARVMQALGGKKRGRAYLEKIVQHQIPLPVTLDDEIDDLFVAELKLLEKELGLPENFNFIQRFSDLKYIVLSLIKTPRDVKRLVGTFRVLGGMLKGEVDWIDLLAYTTLLLKAPLTTEKMRADPSLFLGDPLTPSAVRHFSNLSKKTPEERAGELVAPTEHSPDVIRLVGFIFPYLAASHDRQPEHAESLAGRRPLLTTLRLGLIPGSFPRSVVEELVRKPRGEVFRTISEAHENNKLPGLIDRLDDLYPNVSDIDHQSLWGGISDFLHKPDCEWMTSYQPMHELARQFAGVLERSVRGNEAMKSIARDIFFKLSKEDESELTPMWLRSHFFIYGLFGAKPRGGDDWFFVAPEIKQIALERCAVWRTDHLQGKLIPCRWDLQPVYSLLDTGIWDGQCRDRLENDLLDDRALDGFTLMLYGGAYTTDSTTVAKMCSYEMFKNRVTERLQQPDLHETVRIAMNKALGRWN